MNLPGIYLVRPLSHEDPLFVSINGNFILPKLIKELVRQNILSHGIISLPASTPKNLIKIIESWGIHVNKNGQSSPQERLKQLMLSYEYNQVACFTAYNFFIIRDELKKACDAIVSEDMDFVYTNDVITAKHFCTISINAVKLLCEKSNIPVAPNCFHQVLLDHRDKLNIRSIKGIEEPGERFLWDLHYLGEQQKIPENLLQKFFSETPKEKWFSQHKFKDLLLKHLNVTNWEWLNEYLENRPSLSTKTTEFAAQFAWFNRWLEFIPKKRRAFLEIGFGTFPITSLLLLNLFDEGIAIEPYGFDRKNVSTAMDLCERLIHAIPQLIYSNYITKKQTIKDKEQRLRIELQILENINIPDESINFCFSKTVFEHVMDINTMSAELYRILEPGGTMIHEIDFSDHRYGNAIHFNFLKYSREEWRSKKQGTNLWRITDYIELWEKSGFKTEVLLRKNTNIIPPKVHPSWKVYSRKDLLCHTAVIKAIRKK